MRAVVVTSKGKAEVKDVPIPQPADDEILVKVQAVTLNPTDWKHIKFMSPEGVTSGCDFFGTVEKLAAKPSSTAANLAVGDRVAGFVHGGYFEGIGSFAEFVRVPQDFVVRVPEGIDAAVASSVGIGGYTAGQALFHRLGLKLPSPSAKELPAVGSDEVLIWSGSTSVGQWAIQLARAAGYYVITTASPKNHAFLKELGAAEVWDYKDEETPEKIAEKHPKLNAALDCISENGTQSLVVRSLGSSGGKVVVLLKPEKDAIALRKDVEIIHTLIYTALGHEFKYGNTTFGAEQVKGDHAALQPLLGDGVFASLFANGLVKGNKIKAEQGGLDGIVQGLKYLEEGKVSAEKLAYTIA